MAVRALYELGGTARTDEIADRTVDSTDGAGSGLFIAKRFGLVVSNGGQGAFGGGRGTATWTLTQRGVDLMENRLACRLHDKSAARGYREHLPRFVPTWLSALPRDIRINQGVPA
jgi:hypothetical protein